MEALIIIGVISFIIGAILFGIKNIKEKAQTEQKINES